MHTEVARAARPRITLANDEADALYGLALAARGTSKMAAPLLLEELSRADTCERDRLPADVVTMNSDVVFDDEDSGEQHRVTLVYPRDADLERQCISVLTPIGAGLIGLHCGSTIEWPNRLGMLRRLRIVAVTQPAAQRIGA